MEVQHLYFAYAKNNDNPLQIKKDDKQEEIDVIIASVTTAKQKSVDVSIPYDAAAKLAYETTDKSLDYAIFKANHEADAIASVIAKQPVDVSIPYDAATKRAYEATDKSTDYAIFKANYEADAIASVIAKQPVDVSIPYDAAAKLAYEATDKSMDYAIFKVKYEADAVASVITKQNSIGVNGPSDKDSTLASEASSKSMHKEVSKTSTTSSSISKKDSIAKSNSTIVTANEILLKSQEQSQKRKEISLQPEVQLHLMSKERAKPRRPVLVMDQVIEPNPPRLLLNSFEMVLFGDVENINGKRLTLTGSQIESSPAEMILLGTVNKKSTLQRSNTWTANTNSRSDLIIDQEIDSNPPRFSLSRGIGSRSAKIELLGTAGKNYHDKKIVPRSSKTSASSINSRSRLVLDQIVRPNPPQLSSIGNTGGSSPSARMILFGAGERSNSDGEFALLGRRRTNPRVDLFLNQIFCTNPTRLSLSGSTGSSPAETVIIVKHKSKNIDNYGERSAVLLNDMNSIISTEELGKEESDNEESSKSSSYNEESTKGEEKTGDGNSEGVTNAVNDMDDLKMDKIMIDNKENTNTDGENTEEVI